MEHRRKMKKAQPTSTSSASGSSSSTNTVLRKNEKGSDFLSKIMSAFKEWFYHDADLEELQHQHQHHMITPKIFLKDCTTKEEHYGKIQYVLDNARGRHGLEGLKMVGFDYKFIPCKKHQHGHCNGFNYQAQEQECGEQIGGASSLCTECGTRLYHIGVPSSCNQSHPQHDQHEHEEKNQNEPEHEPQHETKPQHENEHVLITAKNRQRYISDGVMYEAIARLCQEYAQDLMIKAGDLHWVTVCDGSTVQGGGKPIRMLVSRDYYGIGGNIGDEESTSTMASDDKYRGEEKKVDVVDQARTSAILRPRPRPTLLITTGKGKVKAGIFSRQHLLITSIESSTALPMVRDAKHRGSNRANMNMNMNVAILDPNARGDRNGMKTYEESMTTLFGHGQDHRSNATTNTTTSPSTAPINASSSIYILAHSASGAQLTRYLQSDQGKHLIPRVQSIAFTDSNHSIQWLLPRPKKNNNAEKLHHEHEHDKGNDHNAHIFNFYQSPSTIYLKSTNEYRDAGWQTHVAGEVAVDAKSTSQNDIHWQHRFGTTTTLWAGTKDHSLTNWTSHQVIWNHFDKCRCLSEP
jgi:hypothetical protein